MLLRLTTFLVSQVLGAALGGWRAGAWGALAGACVGTWLWLAWDAWRGARVLAWLRQGDAAAAPRLRGLWGEVADRARRLLRQGQQREAAGAFVPDSTGAIAMELHGGVRDVASFLITVDPTGAAHPSGVPIAEARL